MNYQSRAITGLVALMWSLSAQAADVDARIYWGERLEMGVAVSGVIEIVAVDTGQRVNKGDVMLQLEQTPFLAALAQAQAAFTRAKGQRRKAQRDHTHTQELYDRGLVSNDELENYRLKKTAAEADYKAALARLKQAQYDLSHSKLVAPANGWVLGRYVVPGQSIVATDEAKTALVFATHGKYVARGLVGGKKLAELSIGQKATVKVRGNKFEGTITSLGLEPVNPKADKPKYEISVRFQAGKVLLRAGNEAGINF